MYLDNILIDWLWFLGWYSAQNPLPIWWRQASRTLTGGGIKWITQQSHNELSQPLLCVTRAEIWIFKVKTCKIEPPLRRCDSNVSGYVWPDSLNVREWKTFILVFGYCFASAVYQQWPFSIRLDFEVTLETCGGHFRGSGVYSSPVCFHRCDAFCVVQSVWSRSFYWAVSYCVINSV